jgi:hypothetical protein
MTQRENEQTIIITLSYELNQSTKKMNTTISKTFEQLVYQKENLCNNMKKRHISQAIFVTTYFHTF